MSDFIICTNKCIANLYVFDKIDLSASGTKKKTKSIRRNEANAVNKFRNVVNEMKLMQCERKARAFAQFDHINSLDQYHCFVCVRMLYSISDIVYLIRGCVEN